MDDLILINKIQTRLKENLQSIGDAMMAGTGVDNHEKYKYLLGQAHAIQLTLQESSNLLQTKEQNESGGNVVDIKKGSPKA